MKGGPFVFQRPLIEHGRGGQQNVDQQKKREKQKNKTGPACRTRSTWRRTDGTPYRTVLCWALHPNEYLILGPSFGAKKRKRERTTDTRQKTPSHFGERKSWSCRNRARLCGQLAKKQSGNGPLSLPLRNPGHFLKIGNQDPQNLSRHFLNNYQGLWTYNNRDWNWKIGKFHPLNDECLSDVGSSSEPEAERFAAPISLQVHGQFPSTHDGHHLDESSWNWLKYGRWCIRFSWLSGFFFKPNIIRSSSRREKDFTIWPRPDGLLR